MVSWFLKHGGLCHPGVHSFGSNVITGGEDLCPIKRTPLSRRSCCAVILCVFMFTLEERSEPGKFRNYVIREGPLLVQRTLMAFEQTLKKDWYSILGADPSANVSDLKQKYQKLILLYHPDKQRADVPAGTMEERMQKFIEIDQAWKILGNEETKKKYDLQLHEDELRNAGPIDSQVRLEEMSWNEDDESFSLSCRCGGKYTVYKDEAHEANLISCDTCSLIVELLHQS